MSANRMLKMYRKCVLLYFIINVFVVKNSFANVTSEVSGTALTEDVGENLSFEEEESKISDSKQIKLGNTLTYQKLSSLPFSPLQYRPGDGKYSYNFPTEIYQAPLSKSSGAKHRTTKTHPPKSTNQKKNSNTDKNNNKAQASTKSTKSAQSSSKCTNTKKCSVKKEKQEPTSCSSRNKCGQTKTKSTNKRTATRRRCYATSSNSSESCTDSDSETSETESDSSDYTSSDSSSEDGCCRNNRKRCCCKCSSESDSYSDSDSSSESETDESTEESDSSEDSDSSEHHCCKHACDCYTEYSDTDNESEETPSEYDFEFTINSHFNASDSYSETESMSNVDDVNSENLPHNDNIRNIVFISNTSSLNNDDDRDINTINTTEESDVIIMAVSPPMVYLNTSSDSETRDAEDFDETDSENYYAANEYTINSLTRESVDSKNFDDMQNYINNISNIIRKARSSPLSVRYQLEIPTTENNGRSREKDLPLPEDEIRIMNEDFKEHLESLHKPQHKHIGDFINKTSSEIVQKDSIKERLDKIFQQLNGTEDKLRSAVGIHTDLKNLEEKLKDTPLWHGSAGGNAIYKEELQIKEVNLNKKLVIDSPIRNWIGLNNKAVGRYHNILTLVTADGVDFKVNNVEFAEAISAMFMFELWNTETQTLDTILITARDARADWYSFTGDNTLEELWTWELMDQISDIMVFQVYDQWKVLIVCTTPIQNGEVEKYGYSAIFGTNLWKNWWLEQKLSCNGQPTISADSAFIAVAQPELNNVIVYKYNDYKKTYEENRVIKSPGVSRVVAFTSGFDSFFAVTGDNSGIYQVESGSLIYRELEQYHLDHVESWLPINLDYHTNDMVLMFQHKLDHYTHTSTIIEALKWNRDNGKFELLDHQSCFTHQSEVHGFACITEAEGENGIKGAAAVHFNNQPNILLASEQYSPLLFDVETAKVERIDPVQKEVLNVYHKLEELQKKYIAQKNSMYEAEKQLASHKKIIKGRNWTVEKLRTSTINLIGNVQDFLTPESSLTFGEQKWVGITPLLRYRTAIERNAKRLKSVLDKLKKAVKKSELENIKVPFYFNGGLAVKGKVEAIKADIKLLNNVDVDEVFNRVLKKSQDNMFHVKERKVNFLNVNKLVVSGSINGISVSDLSQGIPIVIHDNLKLENPLEVIENVRLKGLLNNIDVNNDIITISESDGFGTATKIFNQYLKFSHLEAKNQLNIEGTMNGMKLQEESLRRQFKRNQGVTVNEVEKLTLLSADIDDLKVDLVNGIKWEEFENNIVFKNAPTNLEELHVSGEIIALENVVINTLNKLAFPSEYVTKQQPSPISISGSKIFANELSAYSLDCSQINGVSPRNFVRLSTDQRLGNFTFYDLSITEKLDIGGDIVGNDLHKILPNPLITETNIINSNMIFKNLEVIGNVYVEKNINGADGDALASELIYKSDEYAVITGPKRFTGEVTVKKRINITSGFINNFNLDEFVTSDTEQYFKRDIILGNVQLNEVNVKGLFGSLNMTDLTENAVRTDVNDQIVQGDVHFRSLDYSYLDYPARDVPEDPVQINNLVVMKNCNGWRVPEDVLTSREARQKVHSLLTTFQHLIVKELIIDGDIITEHKVAGVDIRKFDVERFSLTRNQEITAIFEINNCTMESDLDVKVINKVPIKDIIGAKQKVDNVLEDVFTGKRVVDHLHVAGNLMTSGINSVQLQILAENAIWLNKENHIAGSITFLDPIEVNKLQVEGDFGEVYFPDFTFNVIRKNDNPLELRGTIHFTKTLDITESLDVEYINKMLAKNIILKTNIEDIYSNVFVNGDIHVDNLNVNGYFNSIKLQNLRNALSSPRKDEFHLNGNIEFQDGHRIINLHVNGSVNDYILNDVVDSLVWLNRDSNSSAEVIFRNPATVLGNVQVKNLYNGINLQSLIEDVVYINEDCKIDGHIVFDKPLSIGGKIKIKDSILTDVINSYRISVWRDNAIYLDRPEVLAGIHRWKNVTVRGNLNVNILNNVTLNNMITLNTDQNLYTDLHVDTWEARGNISVANLVNTRKLTDLYDNTLLNYGTQTIFTPLVFRSNVVISKNIDMKYINNIPIENFVTLNTNQNLNGQYIFDSAVAYDMRVGGKLSKINFNEWMRNAVFMSKTGAETISGRWFVKGNLTIVNKMHGNKTIDGHNLTQIQKYLADTEKSIQKYNNYLSSSFNQICHDSVILSNYVQDLNQFKGMQEIQSINTPAKCNVFYIEIKRRSYILINYIEKCKTEVWQWMSEEETLNKINEIQAGHVLHWNKILVNNEEFISSNSSPNELCTVKGVKIWDFSDQYVKHKLSLPNVENISLSVENPTVILAEELGVMQQYELVNKSRTSTPINNSDGERTIHQAELNPKPDATKIVIGNKEMWAHTLENNITIYDGRDTLLQTITTNHPKSLISVRLNNHYTLLVFIENQQSVDTFVYSGLDMFKKVSKLNLEADKLMAVEMRSQNSLGNFVLVIGKKFIKNFKVIMSDDISTININYCNEILSNK